MRRFALLVAGLALLAGVAATVSRGAMQAEARWVITDLGTLGGPSSVPTAINERGQVVGYSSAVTAAKKLRRHAFLWENGEMRDLGTLPGYRWSEATDINERGQIVGRAGKTPDAWMGEARAVLWENGKVRDLGSFGHNGGEAVRINERGQILATRCVDWWDAEGTTCHAFLLENNRMRGVGGKWSYGTGLTERGQVIGITANARDDDGEPIWHAFLWTNGKTRDLGSPGRKESAAVAVNERGYIVGCGGSIELEVYSCDHDVGEHLTALLWQEGKIYKLGTLGGKESQAEDINDHGWVVGGSGTGDGRWHGFFWRSGDMRDLGTLGGKWSQASGVNDRGQVIGTSDTRARGEDGYPIPHAFVWENGKMANLGSLPGYPSSEALVINERGHIVGYAETNAGNGHAVLWTLKRG